jgi:hypothetical protein
LQQRVQLLVLTDAKIEFQIQGDACITSQCHHFNDTFLFFILVRASSRIPKFLPKFAQNVSIFRRFTPPVRAIASDLDDIELSYSLRPNVQSAGKVGVLLLNLGGPDKIEDVQPFLYNLFADPDIIRLPPNARFLQPLIAKSISILRAPKSAEGYKAIGGGWLTRSRQITCHACPTMMPLPSYSAVYAHNAYSSFQPHLCRSAAVLAVVWASVHMI